MLSNMREFLADKLKELVAPPYGNSLLTTPAKIWFFFGRTAIFIMAAEEGLAWGYFGSTLSPNLILASIASLITGLFAFMLVVSIDIALMNFDLYWSYYQEKLFDDPPKLSQKAETIAGFIGRSVFVILSLIVTSPFLTQLFFYTDINKELAVEKSARVAAARELVKNNHDEAIKKVSSFIEKDREELTKEVAGKGISGQRGDNKVAATIRAKIAAETAQLKELEERQTNELTMFDNAVANDDLALLSNRFKVVVGNVGPVERNQALGRVKSSPAFQERERSIKAAFILVFLGLLMLKLFQPKSVAIYLSEHVQDFYKQFKEGNMKEILDSLKVVNKEMTPYEFNDFLINRYSKMIKLQRKESREKELRTLIQECEKTEKQERERFGSAIQNKTQDLKNIESQLTKVEEEKKTQSSKIENLKPQITSATAFVTTLQKELANSKMSTAKQQKQIIVVEAIENLETLNYEMQGLQAIASEIEDKVNHLKNIKKTIEEELKELKKTGKKAVEMRKEKERELLDVLAEIADLRSEIPINFDAASVVF